MYRDWQEAAARGDVAALRALLDEGADVDARDRHGNTALMIAAHKNHLEAVRALAAAGADLDRTAKYGLSALMLAIIAGNDEVAMALIGLGANTELRGTGAPGFAGKSALDLAEELGSNQVARDLHRSSGARGRAE
jgi:ankyrin repeat protein